MDFSTHLCAHLLWENKLFLEIISWENVPQQPQWSPTIPKKQTSGLEQMTKSYQEDQQHVQSQRSPQQKTPKRVRPPYVVRVTSAQSAPTQFYTILSKCATPLRNDDCVWFYEGRKTGDFKRRALCFDPDSFFCDTKPCVFVCVFCLDRCRSVSSSGSTKPSVYRSARTRPSWFKMQHPDRQTSVKSEVWAAWHYLPHDWDGVIRAANQSRDGPFGVKRNKPWLKCVL